LYFKSGKWGGGEALYGFLPGAAASSSAQPLGKAQLLHLIKRGILRWLFDARKIQA